MPAWTLDQLTTFVAVASAATMTAVADELGYTTGAISQQIAVLEAAAGRPLLIRTQRGIQLTDAGIALLPRARQLLTVEQEALVSLSRPGIEQSLPVKLGVFGSIAVAAVGCVTEELRRTAPDVNSKHSKSMSSVCRSMCATPRSTSPWVATEQIRRRSHAIAASAGTQVTPTTGQDTLIAGPAGNSFTAADSACSSYPQTINGIRCTTQTREYPTAGQAAAASGARLDAAGEASV
jgi:Bacterial regulatory helix-turn-helix protein, lysR family